MFQKSFMSFFLSSVLSLTNLEHYKELWTITERSSLQKCVYKYCSTKVLRNFFFDDGCPPLGCQCRKKNWDEWMEPSRENILPQRRQ
jgi:hypothetical protein